MSSLDLGQPLLEVVTAAQLPGLLNALIGEPVPRGSEAHVPWACVQLPWTVAWLLTASGSLALRRPGSNG